jgi:uncharacterized protein YmfQ (DUF2313 family)
MGNAVRDNAYVLGRAFDRVEDSIRLLLDQELYPDTAIGLLEIWEKAYNTKRGDSSSLEQRRARVLAAIRATGGMSEEYFLGLGNTLGSGRYTITIDQPAGLAGSLFIVHQYGPDTDPPGPATPLPAPLYENSTDLAFNWVVNVDGVAGPEEDLEDMFNRLKPAWSRLTFNYIP